jgi:hypothetical protein
MLQKSWGPGRGDGGYALSFMQPYIYTYFHILTRFSAFELVTSSTTVLASERTLEVRENTINMVKVAVEKPDLVHFTHVDVK